MLLEFNEEKVKQWISNGAKPTEAVHRLLAIKGYVEAKKYAEKKETKTVEIIQEKEEIVEPVIKKAKEPILEQEQKFEEEIIQEAAAEAPVVEKEQEVEEEKPEIEESK